MRILLLICLSAVPLAARIQAVTTDGEISAPRFAEGDLDGDGRTELVVAGRVGAFRPVTDPLMGRRARIELQNVQNGLLRPIAHNDEMPVVEDVAVGDVDGDGREEIVAVGWYRLWTLRLQGGALVVVGSDLLATGQFGRVAVADLDGDDQVEVVTAESLREPGSEVGSTAISVYRFERLEGLEGQWRRVARMELAGHVGDLCMGNLGTDGRASLALELGGEEVGGLVQLYDFHGFEPQLRHSQQLTREHVRALSLGLRRVAGRSLLAVGAIGGQIGLWEPRSNGLGEVAVLRMPNGPLYGVHLTQLFAVDGIQVLSGVGGRGRGEVWMSDGF